MCRLLEPFTCAQGTDGEVIRAASCPALGQGVSLLGAASQPQSKRSSSVEHARYRMIEICLQI
jgi:hypothetical protein